MGKNKVHLVVYFLAFVGLILVVALAIYAFGILKANGFLAADSKVSEVKSIDMTNLSGIETEKYIFYFPTKYSRVQADNVDMQYSSVEANSIGGFNSISLVSTAVDSGVRKQSDCDLLVTSLIGDFSKLYQIDVADIEKKRSEYFEEGVVTGCDMKFVLTVNGKVFHIDQMMFTAKGKGAFFVSISYDTESNPDYADLRKAQEYFSPASR